MALNGEPGAPEPDTPAGSDDEQNGWLERRDVHIADLLVDARKAANWTQGQLAVRLPRPDGAPPRTQSFVAKLETLERRLTFTEGFDLCAVLNVNAQVIFDEGVARAKAERDGQYVRESPVRHVRRGRPRKQDSPSLDPQSVPAVRLAPAKPGADEPSRPQAPQSDDVVVPYRDGRRKRPAEARDTAEPSKPNEPPTPDKIR